MWCNEIKTRLLMITFLVKNSFTGYPLALHFQIPCFLSVQTQIFPVPIHVICDYYIHKTDLADLSGFFKKLKFRGKYFLLQESGNLQLEQTKFPVIWQNFQIPCVFPNRDFFLPFSLFSLCSGYPVTMSFMIFSAFRKKDRPLVIMSTRHQPLRNPSGQPSCPKRPGSHPHTRYVNFSPYHFPFYKRINAVSLINILTLYFRTSH